MLRYIPLIALCFASTLHADPALPNEVTTLAFGSCLRQDRPAPILDHIVNAKPDLFIWLGDNIYADSDDPKVVKAKYDALGAVPAFKALRAQTPFLYTWDDHDYGKNDAGAEYAFKDQNKALMLDFFGEPKESERRKRAGNYDSVIIGPAGKRVQFILLDTRSFRSPMKSEMREKTKFYLPTDDPNATVLGDAQWTWLEAQLKEPADLRVIASSIQVLHDTHRFEKWGNFPKERQRLLELLKPIASSTVIISGDRHHGSIHTLDGLLEITASAINQPGTPTAPDVNAKTNRQPPVGKPNFGLIKLTWGADGKPQVEASLVVPALPSP